MIDPKVEQWVMKDSLNNPKNPSGIVNYQRWYETEWSCHLSKKGWGVLINYVIVPLFTNVELILYFLRAVDMSIYLREMFSQDGIELL